MGDTPFPLLCCPAHEKVEMEIVSGDARESRFQEVESKWWKGVSLAYTHEGTS